MKVFVPQVFFLIAAIVLSRTSSFSQSAPCSINLGPDALVCANAVFTLNPQPISSGNYTWSGSPGLSCYNCPSPEVSGLGPGLYTYIARVTSPDCTGAADTLQVTVINGAAPQYVIAPNREICLGDSVELGGPAVGGTFYNWYSVPQGFASSAANPKDKPAVPTLYYLSASNSSCPLPVLDSVRIIPIALSLIVTSGDTVKLCRGSSRTLQAMVAPTGQPIEWSPTAGLQISANGTVAVASPTASTPYTVSAKLGGCMRERTIYAAVDSLPEHLEIIPADTTICEGDSVLLDSPLAVFNPADYPDMTFKWSPLTGALRPDTVFAMMVQPTQPTIYRRITRNRNGNCIDTATVIVRLTPKPQVSASPESVSICPGDTVALSATYSAGATSVEWSPAGGLSCTQCAEPFASPAASAVYTVTAKLQNCVARDSVEVLLKPLALLQFPADVSLCPGDSIVLNELFDADAEYTWTSTHPGFGTVKKPDPKFFPTQTADYFLEAYNGCLRRDTLRVIVSSAILSVEGDTSICKNFPVTLTASVNIPGGTFQWKNEVSGQIEGNMAALTVMPGETTPYSLVFIYGDNCRLTDTATVSIDGEAPEIVFPADPKICPNETITLNSGPVLPGSTYVWSTSPPDPALQQGSAPEVSPAVNTIYTVTASLDQCTVVKQVEITAFRATLSVSPFPDTPVCAKSPVKLKAIGSDPNGTYLWSSGETTSEIIKSPDLPTVYTVVYTYGDTCTLQQTAGINAVPSFDLDMHCVPDTNQVDVGTTVTLTAVVSPPQNLSGFTFTWQETTVDTQTLPFGTESIDVVPSSNDTAAATAGYTLIAVSPNGCSRTVEKTFRLVFPIACFPNAFTPNGDGHNDVFEMIVPRGLAYVERMEIFNRWGQRIFESSMPNAGWDGTANGEESPSDVYAYRVWWRRGDGALQMQSKGNVVLLR